MKRIWTTVIAIGFVLGLGLGTLGCKEEGPMEKAGSKIDESVDKAKEALEDDDE
jgi:hypothetical protein